MKFGIATVGAIVKLKENETILGLNNTHKYVVVEQTLGLSYDEYGKEELICNAIVLCPLHIFNERYCNGYSIIGKTRHFIKDELEDDNVVVKFGEYVEKVELCSADTPYELSEVPYFSARPMKPKVITEWE